jgi:hypothetical protein
MSFQSNSSLPKKYNEGEDAREGNPSNTQNINDSQFNSQQSQLLPDGLEDFFNISSLTAGEHKIYDFLHSHGWSDNKCSIYFRNVKTVQETLVQYFRTKGWSEDQLKAFDDACHSELPEHLSAPPGDNASDYEWQMKMLEEMNRRKRIGENIDFSTSPPETQDRTHS